MMDLPEGKPRRLSAADAREFHPSWSPDGKWIGLRELVARRGPHLEAARRRPGPARRGSRAPRRSTATRSGRPTASGSWRLRAPRQAGWRTRRFGAGAGARPRLGPRRRAATRPSSAPPAGASGPHFAREPDRIYMTTPQGLVSMRFDGTDRRTHLAVTGKTGYSPGEPEPAERDRPLAPTADGCWLASPLSSTCWPCRGSAARHPRSRSTSPPSRSRSSPTSAPTTPPGPTAARRSPGPSAPASSACRSIRSSSRRSRAKTKKREKTKRRPKRKRRHRSPSPRKSRSSIEQPRHRPRGHGRAQRGQGRSRCAATR